MDRAIDAAAAEQAAIGGVDDGVDVKRGDIGLDDRDAAFHRLMVSRRVPDSKARAAPPGLKMARLRRRAALEGGINVMLYHRYERRTITTTSPSSRAIRARFWPACARPRSR